MADATAVLLGPGELYVAAIGTTEPTTAGTALPSAWYTVGYTEEGNTFSYEYTSEDVFVAEELDPVRVVPTARVGSVSFSMAEATRRNLALAMNMGAGQANGTTTLEPPDPSAQVRVMIVFDAEESGARWVFRKTIQTGAVEIARRKAPDKVLIPVTFRLEKPTSLQPWIVIPGTGGLI